MDGQAASTPKPIVHRFLHLHLADAAVVREPQVQLLLISRAMASAGTSLLSYGAMVHLARTGASQLDVSLVGASGWLAALGFGLRGGVVADTLRQRLALGVSYLAQSLLCLLIPTILGVSLAPLLLLIFGISALSQITTPALKTAVAIVATAAEVATVTVLLGVADGIGAAAGSAGLAPILIKLSGMRAVAYVAAGIFAIAAIRALRVPGESLTAALLRVRRDRQSGGQTLGPRDTGAWILAHDAVATVILIGASVTVLGRVFNTLQPVFVRSVLHADPTNSVYIFAPGTIGAGLGSLLAPKLLKRWSERLLALSALLLYGIGITLFGLIDQVTPLLAAFSPLRLLALAGIELNDAVLAAGMIVIPLQFAGTCAAVAVQSYINRRVPVVGQGTTFGMQTVLTSALSIVATLALGALATALNVKLVFFIMPAVVVLLVAALLRLAERSGGEPAPRWGEVFASFWDEPATD